MEPGTSVFVALVEDQWIEQIGKAAEGYNKLAQQTIDADSAVHLGISPKTRHRANKTRCYNRH
ncbi:MAG: hypothetical protein V3S60_10005 [Acidimicrobiia bacterium]